MIERSSAHDGRAVANALITKGVEAGSPLTPLQIGKLSYIAHGWMLGLYGRRLFRQAVLAWLYGPVVRDIYFGLKNYRANGVAKTMDATDEEFDVYENTLIQEVFEEYGHLSGITLSRLTHAPGTPWHRVWHSNGRNSEIPYDLIREHYAEKARGG